MYIIIGNMSTFFYMSSIGITEGLLESLLLGSQIEMPVLPDSPSYGMLLELMDFAEKSAKSTCMRSRPNKVLKYLVDILFPSCSVTRADKLEKRVRALMLPLDSLSEDERKDYLRKRWKPQPTGMILMLHIIRSVFYGLLILCILLFYQSLKSLEYTCMSKSGDFNFWSAVLYAKSL